LSSVAAKVSNTDGANSGAKKVSIDERLDVHVYCKDNEPAGGVEPHSASVKPHANEDVDVDVETTGEGQKVDARDVSMPTSDVVKPDDGVEYVTSPHASTTLHSAGIRTVLEGNKDCNQVRLDSGVNLENPQMEPKSFASLLNPNQVTKRINFRPLINEERVENHDTVLPKAAMDRVSNSADLIMKQEVSMAIPLEDGSGYTKEVRVEYEWKPPHCIDCKLFGHSNDACPKIIREPVTSTTTDTTSDGFTEVTRKKNKGTKADQQSRSRHIGGIWLNKPKPNFYWQKKGTNKSGDVSATKGQMGANSSIYKTNGPSTSNSFDLLNNVDLGDECGVGTASEHTSSTWTEEFKSDDEVDEVIYFFG
ncbi:hypothetical protein Tco_1149431, partial [Tanacetum coccineum]